jgi:lipopolysaccharide transport system ATP-binding protein
MNSDIVISARNVGKCYTIYDRPLDRLKQSVWRKKQFYRKFWALQDASFDIHKGEIIGIIGRNGSGKSTLLQILCNTLSPTTGTVSIQGRIAALLELGAGFNNDFTGRENVYMNGAILGFSKKEMDMRFDEICAFADIGDYIDQPVKTYSSGMYVRLAFAVQACVDPDILIVDEALSVGDIFFQQKCMDKFNELKEQNKTIILVSHDTTLMRDSCDQVIYLKSGQVCFQGDPNNAIYYYLNNLDNSKYLEITAPQLQNKETTVLDKISQPHTFKPTLKYSLWESKSEESFNSTETEVKMIAFAMNDENGLPTLQVTMGSKIRIQVLYWQNSSFCIDLVIQIKNRMNQTISCIKTGSVEQRLAGYYIADFEIDCVLEAGQYTFAACLIRSNSSPNNVTPLDSTPELGPLTIQWDYNSKEAPFLGMFGIPKRVEIHPVNLEMIS